MLLYFAHIITIVLEVFANLQCFRFGEKQSLHFKFLKSYYQKVSLTKGNGTIFT